MQRGIIVNLIVSIIIILCELCHTIEQGTFTCNETMIINNDACIESLRVTYIGMYK